MVRGRRVGRRGERRGRGAALQQVRQRLLSIGNGLWGGTAAGQWAHEVNGSALRLLKTLVFEDAAVDGRTAPVTVSTRRSRSPRTHGAGTAPGQDPVLVPAAAVAVDVTAHRGR